MKARDIFEATEEHDEERVKYFVEKKKVRLTDTDYRLSQTAAHIAAKNGNVNILKYLLEKEPDLVEALDFYGNQIFFLAIENHHFNIVKYLVEKQLADINEKNERCFGNTAIHRAAEYGDLDILKYFVEEQMGDVDVLNSFEQPPLFLAAEKKQYEIIKYLFEEKKANLTLVDVHGQNILYTAVTQDDITLLKYVLDEKKVPFDINWKDKFGDTVAHRAANLNRFKLLQYLVDEKHADIDTIDIWNQTPLHSAARESYYAVCKFLLDHGANTEIASDVGMLPVHEAKDPRIAHLIKEASVKFTKRGPRGQRNRRSVVAEFSQTGQGQWTPRINYNYNPVAGYVGGDTSSVPAGDISSFRLLHFLMVARTIIRDDGKKADYSKIQHSTFLSPFEILRSRMDSLALDSIKVVPCLKDLE